MARPEKEGLDYFPQWKPHMATVSRLGSSDKNVRYKALRNSSSGFIKRSDVRDYVFSRDGYKCVYCGSREHLQVDHIISVYAVLNGKLPIDDLNRAENLQTLCIRCNASKTPDIYGQ